MKAEVLAILDEIQGRYPEDVFPADGASLDCASARFARNIVHQIREKVAAIRDTPKTTDEFTPKQLCEKYSMTSNGMHGRLSHFNCPQTRRRKGPTGRLLTVEMTPELDAFLSQPTSALLRAAAIRNGHGQ